MQSYWTDPDLIFKLIQDSDYPVIANLCHTNARLFDLCNDPRVQVMIAKKYIDYMDKYIDAKTHKYKQEYGNRVTLITDHDRLLAMTRYGDIPALAYLIDYKKNKISEIDPDVESLAEAVYTGNTDVVRFIVRKLDNRDPYIKVALNQALHQASRMGLLDIVEYLLNNTDADPDYLESDGTAADTAASHGHIDVVNLMLKNPRARINKFTLYSAVYGNRPDLVRILLKDGRARADPAVMRHAIQQGYNEIFDLLLSDKNIHPESDDFIESAVVWNRPEMVKKLLQDGRDDPAKDENLALRTAEHKDYYEISDILMADERVRREAEREGYYSSRLAKKIQEEESRRRRSGGE